MTKSGDLIRWFRDALLGKTDAENRVFAWRKTPTAEDELPSINIVLTDTLYERDAGRGADKANHNIAVIIIAEGKEETNQESDADWIIDKLDSLESQIVDNLNFDYMPPSPPDSNIMKAELTEVRTERKEADRTYGIRYMTFNVQSYNKPKKR